MSTLNLTGQLTEKNSIEPSLTKLKSLLEQRRVVWDKFSYESKEVWVNSKKDPVIDSAYSFYQYLHSYFNGKDNDTQSKLFV